MSEITVISRPQGLCFAGNLPKLVMESAEDVRIQLYFGSRILLDETYTPDFDSRVTVDFKDIIINELFIKIPDSILFFQSDAVKEFTIDINEGAATIEFDVLRAGVKNLSQSPEIFSLKNFLTWQSKMKNITTEQPEYLTHYANYNATQTRFMYAKAYFAGGANQNIRIGELPAGFACTADINAVIKNLENIPEKLEVAIFKTDSPDSELLSKYQYYNIIKKLPDEQYFLFENSLGGIDTVRCTGEIKHSPKFTRETALMGDTERTFFAEKSDIKTQTTGWLTKYEAAWLHDFFMSHKIYLFENGAFNPVVIDEVTAETSSKDDLLSFEFKYRPAESSDYLNLNSENITNAGNYWNDAGFWNDTEFWNG